MSAGKLTYEDRSRGGKKAARKNRRNGTGVFNPLIQIFGRHVQHHLNKGVVNPACEMCVAGIEDAKDL
ncbi:MAG TPA: hypothetical protein VOA88_01045 [Candidatus Dormibacteraeota bacterium]|jgi:hypothetical protein|nr:hypothetical protein [Candidatus Dormibacteraeota bacterium]